MNDWEAKRLTRILFDAFPLADPSEGTLEIYRSMLIDLDYGTAERAVLDLIATASTLPSAGKIRTTGFEKELGLPTAEEAYASVTTRGGELHELTKEVAALFGGAHGILSADEPEIVRAQFLRAYGAVRRRRIDRTNVRHLREPRSRAA